MGIYCSSTGFLDLAPYLRNRITYVLRNPSMQIQEYFQDLVRESYSQPFLKWKIYGTFGILRYRRFPACDFWELYDKSSENIQIVPTCFLILLGTVKILFDSLVLYLR